MLNVGGHLCGAVLGAASVFVNGRLYIRNKCQTCSNLSVWSPLATGYVQNS